ncbi:hypothetical protein PIROE2DRAFT_5329 [Piromyces sp. E2]|nr:hypothetical protein PIROE2DRAFT_5329 [Piromyces sp. E2]|eukprot:OUM67269.1 hypothetical protein PIROE2DRAFT_5329 [Piromyces sp. E2]
MLVQSCSSSLPMKYYIDNNRDTFDNGEITSSPNNKQLNRVHIGWQEKEDCLKSFHRSRLFGKFNEKLEENTEMEMEMEMDEENDENVIDICSLTNYQYLPILKIVDFGLAFYTKNNIVISKGHVGTLQYMAPEVVNGIEASYNSDLWSIGATLYECMTCECPYRYRTKWKVDKREKDNEIIKRPQIQNFSDELKYVLSKMLSYDPEERPYYDKYNKNLLYYMPEKCISQIRKLEMENNKDDRNEKSSICKKEQHTVVERENPEVIRIPSGQIQHNGSFGNPDQNQYNIHDDIIEHAEQITTPVEQITKIPDVKQEENLVIDLTTDKKASKTNNTNTKMVSSSFDPDISTLSNTNNNDDEYECITIHKYSNNDLLFKPDKRHTMNGNRNSSNNSLFSRSNSKSRKSNSIKNTNLFEEKTQPPPPPQSQPQSQPQFQSQSQSQSQRQSQLSSKPLEMNQRELFSHSMPEKTDTYVSEIDTIEINEKDEVPMNYPTVYNKKNTKLNSHTNSTSLTNTYFTSTNEISNHHNNKENPMENGYKTSEKKYNRLFVEDIKNDDDDNIIINELSDVSENNNEFHPVSEHESIEIPKRQSKVYKFNHHHKNCKHSTTVNNNFSSIHQSSNEPITMQHPSISSLPTESSTASVIIIQAQAQAQAQAQVQVQAQTDKKSKKSAREPRRYIKQNSHSKSQINNTVDTLQNNNNSIVNNELEANNHALEASHNDLDTFNNINISNESVVSLKFLTDLKEPMEPHYPSQSENSNSFDDDDDDDDDDDVHPLSQRKKQLSLTPSHKALSINPSNTPDDVNHDQIQNNGRQDAIQIPHQRELIIHNDKEVKKSTPRPSAINILLNESITTPVLKSLSTIVEASESDVSTKTHSKPKLPLNSKFKNKNFGIKENATSPLNKNSTSMPFSSSNDSVASFNINSTTSSAQFSQDEYDPSGSRSNSSSSSKKGCFNYQYCYSSEMELNQLSPPPPPPPEEKPKETNKPEKMNKPGKINKTEKLLTKQKMNSNDGNVSVITDIISPIKNVTERNPSALQKEDNTNIGKKDKHKKSSVITTTTITTTTEGSDRLVHRRVKKKIHPSGLSIPNMSSFDLDTENKIEQEITVEAVTTTEMDILHGSEEKMDEVMMNVPSIAYISSMKSQSSSTHSHSHKKEKRKSQKQLQRFHRKSSFGDEVKNSFTFLDNPSPHPNFFHPPSKKSYPRNEFNKFNNHYDTPIKSNANFSTSSSSFSTSNLIKPVNNDKTESEFTLHNQYPSQALSLSNYSQSFDSETSSSPSSSSSSTTPASHIYTSNENSYDISSDYLHHHYDPNVSILPLSTEKSNKNNDIFTTTTTTTTISTSESKTNVVIGQQPSRHYYPYNYSNTFSTKTVKQPQTIPLLKDTKKQDNFSTSISSSFSLNLNTLLYDINLKNSNSIHSDDLEKEIEEILSTSDEEDHNQSKYSYKWTSNTNQSNKNSSQRSRG